MTGGSCWLLMAWNHVWTEGLSIHWLKKLSQNGTAHLYLRTGTCHMHSHMWSFISILQMTSSYMSTLESCNLTKIWERYSLYNLSKFWDSFLAYSCKMEIVTYQAHFVFDQSESWYREGDRWCHSITDHMIQLWCPWPTVSLIQLSLLKY